MKKLLLIALLLVLGGAALWLFEGDFDAAEVDARYSNAHSQFFTMDDGARVHYRDQGNKNGPVVVLVHGSNASLHTWEPWLASLGDGYRVVTLDLPGHGLTGAVPSGNYGSAAQLKTVSALAEQLQLERFVLGGNSMGGGVSWRYALENPEQVTALILIDSSSPWHWRDEAQEAQNSDDAADATEREGPLVFRLLRKPWFRTIAAYLDTRALTRQGLLSAFDDPTKVTDEMVEQYYQLSMREGTRKATLARFQGFGAQQRSPAELDAQLAALTQPTLVLWGETDALIPPSAGERFAATLPNASLIVYPSVGHLPMEEIPAQSANDTLAFLAASGIGPHAN